MDKKKKKSQENHEISIEKSPLAYVEVTIYSACKRTMYTV